MLAMVKARIQYLQNHGEYLINFVGNICAFQQLLLLFYSISYLAWILCSPRNEWLEQISSQPASDRQGCHFVDLALHTLSRTSIRSFFLPFLILKNRKLHLFYYRFSISLTCRISLYDSNIFEANQKWEVMERRSDLGGA